MVEHERRDYRSFHASLFKSLLTDALLIARILEKYFWPKGMMKSNRNNFS